MKPYRADVVLRSPEGESIAFDVAVGTRTITLDSGSDAVGPSPVDAVLAAVGGCTGMDVIAILRKMRQQVTAYTVEVRGERRDEHPRIFTRIEMIHRLRGHDLKSSAVEQAIELSDTKYCSVHAMLRDTVKLESRYEIEAEAPQEAS